MEPLCRIAVTGSLDQGQGEESSPPFMNTEDVSMPLQAAVHPDAGSEGRPTRPRHARSRSEGLDDYRDDGNQRNKRYSGPVDGRVSRPPSHLRAGYSSHIRSASRTSWDGRVALSSSRTPSPSPPHSPVRHSNRPRPFSAVSLPDHTLSRPTVLADRWSYDRERMPSPHSSRPGTPLSEHESSGAAFSRPASTFIDSRSSSRPPFIRVDASTDLDYSRVPSTPTLGAPILKLIPPPVGDPGSQQQEQKSNRQSYHLLTSEEMDRLSHPPMSASPFSPSSMTATPKLSNEVSRLGPPKQKGQGYSHAGEGEEEHGSKPGCMGLCEIATARSIGGKFGAWFMGMVIPVTFGLVTGCVAAVAGCK